MKYLLMLAMIFGAQLAAAQVPNVNCFASLDKMSDGLIVNSHKSNGWKVITENQVVRFQDFSISTRMEGIFPVNAGGQMRGRPTGVPSVPQSGGLPGPYETPPGPTPYRLILEIANGEAKSSANSTVFSNRMMTPLIAKLTVDDRVLVLTCVQEL